AECLGPEFDLARWCRKAARIAVRVRLRVFLVFRVQLYPHAARLSAQLLQAQPAGGKLVTIGSVDIAVPELCAEAKPDREIEDDVGIRSRLARRWHHSLAVLHQGLGVRIDFEANAQSLALECGGDRQYDV